MNRRVRIASALAGGLVLIAAPAPASADPNGESLSVACDNGVTYEVVVNGNGDFTPAHDLASTSMLVPTWFGPFHGVVTDSEGTVVDEFTDPAQSKGASTRDRRTSTTCTFAIEETFDDPDLGTLTFTGSGTVAGFVTPVR